MQYAPRVAVSNLTKTFGTTTVVDGVSLDIRPGEIHALVGENGAGKSTLTKMIAGVYRPDGGSIFMDGTPVQFRSPHEAIAAGISTVHQELNLIPELDCASNIALGSEATFFSFIRQSAIRRRADPAMKAVGSRARPDTLVGDLPAGERQLVEIAKALASDARLVIMDEPTAALSTSEIDTLHNCVRALKARGISIIYITHKMAEIFALADRVSVLRDGRYVTTVDTARTSRKELLNFMLGRSLEALTGMRPGRDVLAEAQEDVPRLQVDDLSTGGLVRNVSFGVRSGEILGFAGLVGAGRTEVMRALAGIDRISSGSIRLEGRPMKPRNPAQMQAEGLVLVPEDRKTEGLLLDQPVQDNIVLPHLASLTRFGIVNDRAARRMARECIDKFDVRPKRLDIDIGLLSGGNQQKVLIGRWLLKNYAVVIFDEPSKGVDVGARAGIWEIIERVAAQGCAVIVVSSETEELLALSHRIAVMRQGRLSAVLDNAGLTEEKVMQYAF